MLSLMRMVAGAQSDLLVAGNGHIGQEGEVAANIPETGQHLGPGVAVRRG